MSLDDILRSGIVNLVKTELEGVDIGTLRDFGYHHDYFNALGILYNTNIIRFDHVRDGLSVGVLRAARTDYDLIQELKRNSGIVRYADHVHYPKCFAHALKAGHFTEEEISQIPFDDDLDKEGYEKRYGDENLLPQLVRLITSYSTRKDNNRFGIEQPIKL